VISQTPLLHFIDPSHTSGRDYATDNDNPWDMDSSGSDGTVYGSTGHQFIGGQVDARNTGNDPGFLFNLPERIDTSYYRYFIIEFYSQYSFYTGSGGMSRVYWMNDFDEPTTTEDIIINVPAEWRTYAIDLQQAPIEPSGEQNAWTSSKWRLLRFDPNENTDGLNWNWSIRDVKLTGPPEADTGFTLRWEIDNPEKELVDVDLYYDTDDAGFDGAYIGTASSMASPSARSAWLNEATSRQQDDYDNHIYLPMVSREHCLGECLRWDTSGIPNGDYFVYACLDDGLNQTCRYSPVPIRVDHGS
jgi:hypothetical protein